MKLLFPLEFIKKKRKKRSFVLRLNVVLDCLKQIGIRFGTANTLFTISLNPQVTNLKPFTRIM